MAELIHGTCGECGGYDKDLIRTNDDCTYCAECLLEQISFGHRTLGDHGSRAGRCVWCGDHPPAICESCVNCESCGDATAMYCEGCNAGHCGNCGDTGTYGDLLCEDCRPSGRCYECGYDGTLYCEDCNTNYFTCAWCGEESNYCSAGCALSNGDELYCSECGDPVEALCNECSGEMRSPVLMAAENIRINDTQVEVDGVTFDFDT